MGGGSGLEREAIAFAAALLAGALNSVAGGGSFISFPALLLVGLPPIVANATNNTAMWLGTLSSVGGYREELAG
ncbi:MAG: TSUP family transporter, partial [Candidatus Baltobacteraceae bacterium]